MAHVFAQFADPVVSQDGARYRAQACGAPMADGLWEGWVEFTPVGGGPPIRSPRETTQPNRGETVYWAAGLTPIYLEDALERALTPLNPFSLYEKGEAVLRGELSAVSTWQLVNIIMTHHLSDEPATVLDRLPALMLSDLIVMGVRDHVHGSGVTFAG
jgi:hypothetical protein